MVLSSLLVKGPISGQSQVLYGGPSFYLDHALHPEEFASHAL
jgi:hypothetical protein